MINVAQLKDRVKSIQANLNSVKNLPSPGVNFENLFTLNEIEACLSLPEEEVATALTSSLKKRWNRICNTQLAYANSQDHPINLLCLDIAKNLPPQVNGMGPYLYLMPTLWGNHDYGIDINTLRFHQFIITEDGNHFIPVVEGLHRLVIDRFNNFPTSPNEEHLITLSTHTEEYFGLLCKLKSQIRHLVNPEGKAHLLDALAYMKNILDHSLQEGITEAELLSLRELLDLDFLWKGFNKNDSNIDYIEYDIYPKVYDFLGDAKKLPSMTPQERTALQHKIQVFHEEIKKEPVKNIDFLGPSQHFEETWGEIQNTPPIDFQSALDLATKLIKKRMVVQESKYEIRPTSSFPNPILLMLNSWESGDLPTEYEKIAFLNTLKLNNSDKAFDPRNSISSDGNPLSKAIVVANKLNDPIIVSALIQAGADINYGDNQTSPLLEAIRVNNQLLVKILLENNAELTIQHILFALRKDHSEILTTLLLYACSLPENNIDKLLENSGQINLICWVAQRSPKILPIFLEKLESQHNLDFSVLGKKNKDGKTPYELASSNRDAMHAILGRQLIHALKNRNPNVVIRLLAETDQHNLLNSKDLEIALKLSSANEMFLIEQAISVYKNIRELYEYGKQLKTDRSYSNRKLGHQICEQAQKLKLKTNNFILSIHNFDSQNETESLSKVETARVEFALILQEEIPACSMIFSRLKLSVKKFGLEPLAKDLLLDKKVEKAKNYKHLFNSIKAKGR
jgi:hypothetical protein